MTHRIFTGLTPDGRQVLVQIWDDAAEVAFRDESHHTWGVPSSLAEEPATTPVSPAAYSWGGTS